MHSKIIKIIFLYLFLFAQSIVAQENKVDFSRSYYSDLAGYHAVGSHTADNREEAVRLAKSEAIKRIFKEIGKDALFQEMFISAMPQFITKEGEEVVIAEDDSKTARVKILIDNNAVIILEQQYNTAVAELLNRGEAYLLEAEKSLLEGDNAELNLRMSDALLHYRIARTRCKEVDDLLKDVKNSTITSDAGNNSLLVKQQSKTYMARALSGFARVQKLEVKQEENAALDELLKTFDLLLAEKLNIESVVDENSYLQPFYDMPRSELEAISLQISQSIEMAGTVKEKLIFLIDQIPQDRYLLKEKVGITTEEIGFLEMGLKKMKKDVLLEIRDPRLKRQERARKVKEIQGRLKEAFIYAFTHEPGDVFVTRSYIPVEWDMDSAPELTGETQLYLRAEKAFYSGFWIRSQFTVDTTNLLNTLKSNSLAQEFSLGYFRDRFLFGAGFGWDWSHWLEDVNSNITELERELLVKIYFGGVDSNRSRADWLLSVTYEIPGFAEPFVLGYMMNTDLDLLIRIENVLFIETSLASRTLIAQNDGVWDYEDLEYQFSWDGGIAIRYPGPFGWGIYFKSDSAAPVIGSSSFGDFTTKKYWSAFVEYSF